MREMRVFCSFKTGLAGVVDLPAVSFPPRPTADRRSAIDERRATIADRCARAVRGGAPGRCRLVVSGSIFSGKKILFHRIPNARHRPPPQAVGHEGVGARASQVFRVGVRRNFAVGRRSGMGAESLY